MSDATIAAGTESAGEPQGNARVLGISLAAFSLGFAVWAMFSALAPFLKKWYHFDSSQVLLLAAMEPLGAMLLSLPLGIATDRWGGRRVFSLLLVILSGALLLGLVASGYSEFLVMGTILGLGGASFAVGNAHVSSWYPRARQGTALGIFALGNAGVIIGMVAVPLLVKHVLGGPAGYHKLPPKVSLGPIEGFRLVFAIFAVATLLMAAVYWLFTSEAPGRDRKMSVRQIAEVYRTSRRAWIIAYLYWVSFGTLTFFAASMPTYLNDRWHIDAAKASMVCTAIMVACVAVMRPLGGWLADRGDALRLLARLIAVSCVCAVVGTLEISFTVQIAAFYSLAMASGAAAAVVVKLISAYFKEVGAVSGLAKAAGAACGFTMTSLMSLSKGAVASYAPAFIIWAIMNVVAFVIAVRRIGFADQRQEAPAELAPVPELA